jgi:hypothetical protein
MGFYQMLFCLILGYYIYMGVLSNIIMSEKWGFLGYRFDYGVLSNTVLLKNGGFCLSSKRDGCQQKYFCRK